MFEKTHNVLFKNIFCCSKCITRILEDSSNYLDEKIFRPLNDDKDILHQSCACFLIKTKMAGHPLSG